LNHAKTVVSLRSTLRLLSFKSREDDFQDSDDSLAHGFAVRHPETLTPFASRFARRR